VWLDFERDKTQKKKIRKKVEGEKKLAKKGEKKEKEEKKYGCGHHTHKGVMISFTYSKIEAISCCNIPQFLLINYYSFSQTK